MRKGGRPGVGVTNRAAAIVKVYDSALARRGDEGPHQLTSEAVVECAGQQDAGGDITIVARHHGSRAAAALPLEEILRICTTAPVRLHRRGAHRRERDE